MLTLALALLQFVATPLVPAYRIGTQASVLGGGSARQASTGMTEEETRDSISEVAIAARGKGFRLAHGLGSPASRVSRRASSHRGVAGVRGPHGRLGSGGRAIRLQLQSHRC